MNRIVYAETMQAIDDYTIKEIGIPSMVLMERAALEVVNKVKEQASVKDKILAICGRGNNGADALAVARILKLQGYDADVLLLGDKKRSSNELIKQINIAKNLDISIYNNISINEYTIIIDGIFGIGLNKEVTGIYLDYINLINKGNHTVFSVDLPSGLSANNGRSLGAAIKADYTITFGYNKLGLILYPGCDYAGDLTIADIGFPNISPGKEDYNYYTYDESDLIKLPKRKKDSHKGDYGKVLVIAGTIGMNGACYLASLAALSTGAGIVKALAPKENRQIMQTILPEVILSSYESKDKLKDEEIIEISQDISKASVIIIGPGLGTSKASKQLLDLALNNAKVPLVIDADGINILSELLDNTLDKDEHNVKDRIEKLKEWLPQDTILTPHIKELSRLLQVDVSKIKDNIMEVANICTKNNTNIYVMKDARTIVAHENNRFINTTGNNGMSTGGSGDVLTGIIAGLIAQGISPMEAASLGVYVHGLSGDIISREKNQFSIIARDIIDGLAKI